MCHVREKRRIQAEGSISAVCGLFLNVKSVVASAGASSLKARFENMSKAGEEESRRRAQEERQRREEREKREKEAWKKAEEVRNE